MIYTSKNGVALQRKDKYYRFTEGVYTSGWYKLLKDIDKIDSNWKTIGPTILVEWEE